MTSNKQIDSPKYKDGYLKLVVGCMFSGKTSYIIKECLAWKSIGKTVLIVNYSLDTRYSANNEVVSHDKYGVDALMTTKLEDIDAQSHDVILVNEGQFFDNLQKHVRYWCDTLKKIVVVSGLDGDYKRSEFGDIGKLMSDCDELVKLKAYCSECKNGTEAIFTWKKSNRTTEIIDIGGSDKYVPLCRKHYNEHTKIE